MPDATNPLASYQAAVDATRQRLELAATPTAYNLALADYTEAKATLRGAQRALGLAA